MAEHVDRADYYVEKVHYNKGHNKIVWASVRMNDGKRLGGAYNMLRSQMVKLLKQGKAFMTIYRSPEGKFRPGQKLSVVDVQGEPYLRTNSDPVDTDELQDVPEF